MQKNNINNINYTNFNYKKATVLITGSGTGLGKEAAILLAKRGHKVYATTMYEEESVNLNNFATKHNLPISSFKLNILLEDDKKKLNDIDFDVIINNAAIGNSGSVSEVPISDFIEVFNTNVFSNISITQVALSKMIQKKYGKVIFLSSLAGRITIPFLSPYCSSKFAIEGFAMALRAEMKKLDGTKIQVCVIEPGAYATGFNKENNEKKFKWMQYHSYFKYKWQKIKNDEEKYWNFIEKKPFDSIIKKYIKAVESNNVKKRYTAPKIQAFIIQLQRIFGK